MRNRRMTSEILWGLYKKFKPRNERPRRTRGAWMTPKPREIWNDAIWSNSAEVRRLSRRQFSAVMINVDWEVKRT